MCYASTPGASDVCFSMEMGVTSLPEVPNLVRFWEPIHRSFKLRFPLLHMVKCRISEMKETADWKRAQIKEKQQFQALRVPTDPPRCFLAGTGWN